MDRLEAVVAFYVLIWMFVAHWIVDFHQGWMASAKTKEYWVNNYPEMNHKDYIPVLAYHALVWSFIMMLPILLLQQVVRGYQTELSILLFAINFLIHFMVDTMKNQKRINLVFDQVCHAIQIVATFIILLAEVYIH